MKEPNSNPSNNRSHVGSGGRGGSRQQQHHHQQHNHNQQQSQNQSTQSSSVTSKIQQQQPKPNAWSKPLQAATSSAAARNVTPPPGLGINVAGSSRAVTSSSNNSRFASSSASRSLASHANGQHQPDSTNSTTNSSTLHSNAAFATEVALRERFVHLVTVMIGQKVTVTLKSGTIVTGILHTATPFPQVPTSQRNKYVLKTVHVEKEGIPDRPIVPGQTLVLNMNSVAQLHLKSIRLDQLINSSGTNGSSNSDSFVTDAEISKLSISKSSNSRELVQAGAAWTSGGKDSLISETSIGSNVSLSGTGTIIGSNSGDDLPINSRAAKLAGVSAGATSSTASSASGLLKGSIAEWDQFKANKELFNVSGKFDETVYTTPLDKSSLEADKIARAEKIAREIESTVAHNIHLAEERGQISQIEMLTGDEFDEEDKYSGVLSQKKLASTQLSTVSDSTPSQQSKPSANETVDNSTLSNVPITPNSTQGPQVMTSNTKPKLNYAQAVAATKQSSVTGTAKKTHSLPPPGFPVDKTMLSKSSSTNPKKEVLELEDSNLLKKHIKRHGQAEVIIEKQPAETNNGKVVLEVEKAEPAQTPKDAAIDSETLKQKEEIKQKETVSENLDIKESEEPICTFTETVVLPIEQQVDESHSLKPDETTQNSDDATTSAAVAKSKLNANAKEFTLNVSAKPFTPPSTIIQPQQQLPPPQMQMQAQHLQQQHQFQPQYFDPTTGMPIPMHPIPPYGGAGAHMPPHHIQVPGSHHMMSAHHMMGTSQPHHYVGQYPVMRGFPGQYLDPHVMQQQQPPNMQQLAPPLPVPPLSVPNGAPSTSNVVTSARPSGANTPIVSEECEESPAQPHDGNEQQPIVVQPPPQALQQQLAPIQWQQSHAAYYGAPMHLQHQGQQRMVGPGPYPPQQFMHHSQMAAMQQMRQHQMYTSMVGVGSVSSAPPQMRTGATSAGSTGGGSIVASTASPAVIPYIPGPHTHMGGQYQPYNIHVGSAASATTGVITGGVNVTTPNPSYSGEDDGQGGYNGRGGTAGRGARGGRARGRGRPGRGRSTGRFNTQQPYLSQSQTNVTAGNGGSQPGSGRQTPQSVSNNLTDGEMDGKTLMMMDSDAGSDGVVFDGGNETSNTNTSA